MDIVEFNGIVLSVLDDVPVNSEAPVVISSISSLCRNQSSKMLVVDQFAGCMMMFDLLMLFALLVNT